MEHSSTSSESTYSREAEMAMHEGTSSEHDELDLESDTDLREESNEGASYAGDVEDVEGMNESRLEEEEENLLELQAEVEVTEELEDLPHAGELEFGEIGPESVCGKDDRVRISPATRVPWRWICQLIITMANGRRSRCTGWFIGPRTVMTSGHCVFSRANGGWARRIEVIPGLDVSSRPYGSQVGTSFRSVYGWTRSGNSDFDYGCIILPDGRLGSRVGWFGFECRSTSGLNSLLINTSGYPGDKPFGTQWFNAGRITRVTNRKIEYMVDTFGGQSGSAVWRYWGGRRYAVGIHGYGGCPNKAIRIVRPVFNNMVSWKYRP